MTDFKPTDVKKENTGSDELEFNFDGLFLGDNTDDLSVPGQDSGASGEVVGLPSPKGGVGLPSPKVSAGLPSPKVSAGLPSPKVSTGLPSPKVSAGLPSPKEAVGLSSPKSGANPNAAGAGFDPFGLGLDDDFAGADADPGLPSPKAGAGHAAHGADDGLPLPKAGRASQAGVGLLSGGIGQDAIRAKSATRMFSGTLESHSSASSPSVAPASAGILGTQGPSGIPAGIGAGISASSSPSLIPTAGVSASHKPAGKNLGDSSLGVVKTGNAINAPVLKLDHEEPTGAFNQSRDIDNDSGLPIMDDPLGLNFSVPSDTANAPAKGMKHTPSVQTAAPEPALDMPNFDVLGLLGPEPDAAPAGKAGSDVPGFEQPTEPLAAPPRPRVPSIQSGTAVPLIPTMPLNSPVPTIPAPQQPVGPTVPLVSSAAPVPPTPKPPQQNPLLGAPGGIATNNAPVIQQPYAGNLVEAEDPQAEGELVFDLNSIKSDKGSIAREDNRKKSAVRKSSPGRKIGFIVAVVLIVLAILGVAVYRGMLNMQTVSEDELAVIPEEAKAVVRWDTVKLDSREGYMAFYRQAVKRLGQKDIDDKERQEIQGQVLISTALASVRFPDALADQIEILNNSVQEISKKCDSSWCALGLWSWGKFQNQPELVKSVEDKLSSDKKDIQNVVQNAMMYREWRGKTQSLAESMKGAEAIVQNFKDSDWPIVTWMKVDALESIGRFDETDKLLDKALKAASEQENSIVPSALMVQKARTDLALDRIEQADKTLTELMELQTASADDKVIAKRLSLFTRSALGDWAEEQKNLSDYLKANVKRNADVEAVADACFRLNKASDCDTAFRVQLEADPQNALLRAELIRMLFDEMDVSAVFDPSKVLGKAPLVPIDQLIEDGIKLAPDSHEIWGAKALSAFAARDYETMENAVDEVERGEPKVWFGAFLRQLKAFATGDAAQKEAARNSLKKYVSEVQDVDTAIALNYSLRAVGDLDSAVRVIEMMARIHPDNTRVMNAYFITAIDRKDKDTAESILKRLEKRSALMPGHEYNYARLVDALGDTNGALERMIILSDKTEGGNPEYLAYIGELFVKQKKCESALPKFIQALEINPTDPNTHFNKGFCLYQDKKYEEALVEFNEAAAQDDVNRKYDLWIGLSMRQLKMNSDAQRAFSTVVDDYTEKAEELRTADDTALAAQAYFYRAGINKLQNHRGESAADYLQALAMDPDNPQFLSGYAVFLYENSKMKECIEMVDRVESQSADKMDARLYFVRGLAKLNRSKRPEALADLENALKHGFADLEDSGIIGVREPAEIYERLGYLYRDLGRKAEAREMLRTFIEKSQTLSDHARKDILGDIDKI